MTNARSLPALAHWGLLLVATAGTRLPGPRPAWAVVAIGCVALLVLLRKLLPGAQRFLASALFAASLGLMLVPISPEAPLVWLSPWAVAILYAWTLHVAFHDRPANPEAKGKGAGLAWRGYVALVAALALVVALPLAKGLLPLRIRAAFELQTALEPLVSLVAVGGVLAIGALARIAAESRHPARVIEGVASDLTEIKP